MTHIQCQWHRYSVSDTGTVSDKGIVSVTQLQCQ